MTQRQVKKFTEWPLAAFVATIFSPFPAFAALVFIWAMVLEGRLPFMELLGLGPWFYAISWPCIFVLVWFIRRSK